MVLPKPHRQLVLVTTLAATGFACKIFIYQVFHGHGSGTSKKTARGRAALKTLVRLTTFMMPVSPVPEPALSSSPSSPNLTSCLAPSTDTEEATSTTRFCHVLGIDLDNTMIRANNTNNTNAVDDRDCAVNAGANSEDKKNQKN